jgi:hypothetical protein
MDDRLRDGQPPLRVSQVAASIGYSDRFVQKLMDVGALAFVETPGSMVGRRPERRVPVAEVRRLRLQLAVGGEKGEQGEQGEQSRLNP